MEYACPPVGAGLGCACSGHTGARGWPLVQLAVSPGFNSCGQFFVWGQIPGKSQFVCMLGGTADTDQGHSLQLAEQGATLKDP